MRARRPRISARSTTCSARSRPCAARSTTCRGPRPATSCLAVDSRPAGLRRACRTRPGGARHRGRRHSYLLAPAGGARARERVEHVYIAVAAGAAPQGFDEWIGAIATGRRAVAQLDSDAGGSAGVERQAFVSGRRLAPPARPRTFRPRSRRRPSRPPCVPRPLPAACRPARPGDRHGRRRHPLTRRRPASAAAEVTRPHLRRRAPVRHAAHPRVDVVRVAGGRRPGAPPHCRGPRDVAAAAPAARRVAAHRWRREPDRARDRRGRVGGRDRRARAGVQRRRGGDDAGRGRTVAAPAQGHGRPVREPRPPEPEPARAPARAARRARAQRARPGRARRAVQARPHGDPHAAQRREPARAVGRRATAPVAAADRPARRRPLRRGRDRRLPPGRARRDRRRPRGVRSGGVRRRAPRRRAARERHLVLAARCRGRRVGRRPGTVSCSRSPTRASACRASASSSANELLAHPPVVGLALTRALGLHVVGSLAARHAIAVELRAGAPLGTVALVTLPHAILEGVEAAEPLVPVPATPPESMPLTARRTGAWRPDDEPPVEEWRREGMVTATAPGCRPARLRRAGAGASKRSRLFRRRKPLSPRVSRRRRPPVGGDEPVLRRGRTRCRHAFPATT